MFITLLEDRKGERILDHAKQKKETVIYIEDGI